MTSDLRAAAELLLSLVPIESGLWDKPGEKWSDEDKALWICAGAFLKAYRNDKRPTSPSLPPKEMSKNPVNAAGQALIERINKYEKAYNLNPEYAEALCNDVMAAKDYAALSEIEELLDFMDDDYYNRMTSGY